MYVLVYCAYNYIHIDVHTYIYNHIYICMLSIAP